MSASKWRNVSGYRLIIRKEPKRNAPQVGTLMQGAEVLIDDAFEVVSGGFVYVKVNGEEKYIALGETQGEVVTFTKMLLTEQYLRAV